MNNIKLDDFIVCKLKLLMFYKKGKGCGNKLIKNIEMLIFVRYQRMRKWWNW
jgi:hypothetical protein